MLRAFASLLAVVILVAATQAAPVPKHLMPKNEPLYFPTTVGTKWVYDHNGQAEITNEITAVEEKGGGKLVTVNGNSARPTRWHVSRAGVYIVSMGDEECKPAIPMLQLPHAPGATWTTESMHGSKLKGLFASHGPELVEVGAGKFQAIRVEVEWVGNNKVTFWYAPDVGVVKAAGGLRKELKSFKPGKG
ncbi:Uncharacterized protein OS=Pirellula staleyi (strain ATCC 27377 / DSM 6068 / ICPB 4128) GN=Psta_2333 PE=4 SV=1 [Gemmata massiliana]|uniref:Uncharacterized protein n=1 Tax=Gemmata massiliana TaxID=1210884 RepID=A0A6P2CZQ9_9BACT|nr:hypothetical protein [Gemmata massiliana]VTR94628.1 Uncharacterized protein OS=Pirellula staleyi (strain ATCC 27377 / DSM 6068 / ICPB 4128) GN=Psta_2333 PE=4 SV=1 [Gemmata massiliana]